MNNFWSTYIQTSEELYASRDIRFNDTNKQLWLNTIGIKENMNVLDIGCGSGTFCNKIKQYTNNVNITGIDIDNNHIAYAKNKANELNLNVNFLLGDATKLPFEDNSFDLCYSYTVCEHIEPKVFLKEQYRVLIPTGTICILSVRKPLRLRHNMDLLMCEREKELLQKLDCQANKIGIISSICKFKLNESMFINYLEETGFNNISISMFNILNYGPDLKQVSKELALKQIQCYRLHSTSYVQKILSQIPNAITQNEINELLSLINNRYDKRIELYNTGKKLWDFTFSAVLAINATK